MAVTPGTQFAQRFLAIDWGDVVLKTCAKRRWKVATLARRVNSSPLHLQNIARGTVREPHSFRVAFRLLDEYQDANT